MIHAALLGLLLPPAAARPVDEGPLRVVGGEVETGFDATVALTDGSFLCTASLFDARHALTAAHCLEGVYSSAGLLSVLDDQLELLSTVEAHAVHPSFDRHQLPSRVFASGDIAVLRLTWELSVEPIPLRLEHIPTDDAGRDALFVGFGITSENAPSTSGTKRSGEVRLTAALGDTLVSLDDADAPHVCSGDSGGPLYHDGPNGWEQWGVTARGDCSSAGTWTRTDTYAQWIDEAVEKLDRRHGGACAHSSSPAWLLALLGLAARRRTLGLAVTLTACTNPCEALNRRITERFAACDASAGEGKRPTGPSFCDTTSAERADCLGDCYEAAPCVAVTEDPDFELGSCLAACFGPGETGF